MSDSHSPQEFHPPEPAMERGPLANVSNEGLEGRARRAHAALELLANQADGMLPLPALDARRRLHARWQHLVVRPSWRNRLLFWYREFLEPELLTPLVPHAALIVGFVFLSLNLGMVQRYQFGVNLNSEITRQAVLAKVELPRVVTQPSVRV